jgi:hypothetical protein
MNFDIFKMPDPSGKLTKESYLLKNHTEEYDYILKYCEENQIFDINFKEKVYLCLNNIKKLPVCKNQNCNQLVKFRNSTLGFREYCSNKCISSDPNIKKLKEEKSYEKFGTKTPAESKIIKEKIIRTNQERYGFNSAMCHKKTQEKSKNTLFFNFGVTNPSLSQDILKKRIESFKNSNFKENYKKTSLVKWGVEHPWMINEIHDLTVLNSITARNQILQKKIENRLDNYNQYKLIDIEFNKYKRNIIIFCESCYNNFNINREDLYLRSREKTTICTNCNPINSSKSGQQEELFRFISENYDGEILLNKKIISPQEIDIYLPELKLAFEFNGLWWHSEQQKGKYYHRDKTKKCFGIGVELVHIWEDDWIYKNEIVRSIILNRLRKNSNKIFSRNCNVSLVSQKESQEFLEQNHILGNCKSNVKVGLYYKNDLVSLMCFTKHGGYYELSRFCNKLNNSVVGSSSKLFSYFISNYNFEYIVSYSDNSMFTGNIYQKIGFEFDGETTINYKWVISKKRLHKSNFRKSRLIQSGYDKNKSESEIMIEDVGAYKIWDCGLKKWIFTNK